MAIEIKPRADIKKNWWKILVLFFSIVIFLFLLVSYFYIQHISQKMSQEIENKDQFLTGTASEKELEKELLLYQSKISIFEKLFSSHKRPLNIFVLFEGITHPKVWFSNFTFDSLKGTAIVSGQAESFMDLGQQVAILKEKKDFEEVILSSISMNQEGKIDFSLLLVIKPEVILSR